MGVLFTIPVATVLAIADSPELDDGLTALLTVLTVPLAFVCVAAAGLAAWSILRRTTTAHPGRSAWTAVGISAAIVLVIDVVFVAFAVFGGAVVMVLAYDASVGGSRIPPRAILVVSIVVIGALSALVGTLVTRAVSRSRAILSGVGTGTPPPAPRI